MTQYTYLLVNLGAVIVPLLYSFHPKLRFWKHIRAFIYANLITSLGFIVWDILFTGWGVWGFNSRYLTGLYIANLPLEEVLFFICIPYACLFSYHCFEVLRCRFFPAKVVRVVTVILCGFSLVMFVINVERLYPAVTFLLLLCFLLYVQFIREATWLSQFYFTYLIMLIPFFIVNGILTGTGLQEPVVWYNSAEIINFRLVTIPFEDVFYGMLLVGVNVLLYEYFRSVRVGIKQPRGVLLSE